MTAVATAAPLRIDLPGARAALSRRSPATAAGSVSLQVRGGDAEGVLDARARLAGAVGLDAADLVWAQQVHGAGVAVVGRDHRGRGAHDHQTAVPQVDALVTAADGVGVAVLAADCVPVALAAGGAVAAVHAGRRGMTTGVVGAAVGALRLLGSLDGDAVVHAAVGPGIGGCCYELPAALAVSIAASEPAAAARTTWGTPSVDVVAGVLAQLERAGAVAVQVVEGCTRCGDGGFFSARRDAGEAGDGRHALVVTPADGAVAPPRPAADASLD